MFPGLGAGALQVITPMSPGGPASGFGAFTVASRTWPAGDKAIYSPLTIDHPVIARKLIWTSGSVVAGNADIGLYDAGGRRLVSQGSVLVVGTNTLEVYDISPDLYLDVGTFYLALVMSSVVCQVYAGTTTNAEGGQIIGQFEQASALPLPATATPASMSSAGFLLHAALVATVGL